MTSLKTRRASRRYWSHSPYFETDHSRAHRSFHLSSQGLKDNSHPPGHARTEQPGYHCRKKKHCAWNKQVTYDMIHKQHRAYDPPFIVVTFAAAYARRMFCSLAFFFGRVPAPVVTLAFRCGCSLIWEKVAARCLSLSAFFKNGLGRFSSSCRSHWTGEGGVDPR